MDCIHESLKYKCPNCGAINCFKCCISLVLAGWSLDNESSCMACCNCYTNFDIPTPTHKATK